jgi:hypothetical protein
MSSYIILEDQSYKPAHKKLEDDHIDGQNSLNTLLLITQATTQVYKGYRKGHSGGRW